MAKPSSSACATSMRSKGSPWRLGRAARRRTWRGSIGRGVVFEPRDRIIKIGGDRDQATCAAENGLWERVRGRFRTDDLGDLTIAVRQDDVLTFGRLPDQLGELPCGFGNGDPVHAYILAEGQIVSRGQREP